MGRAISPNQSQSLGPFNPMSIVQAHIIKLEFNTDCKVLNESNPEYALFIWVHIRN